MTSSDGPTDAPAADAEQARLSRLAEYDILEAGPDPAFDDLARLAAALLATPMSTVALIDGRRQWYMGHVGEIGAEQRWDDRDAGLCELVVTSRARLVIPDLTQDPRSSAKPAVTGGPQVRFYAGTPLMDDDGFALGALCVMDYVPRQPTDEQLELLDRLATQTMAQLALKRATMTARWQAAELSGILNGATQQAIFATDPSGSITLFSKGAELMTGYSAVEMIGTTPLRLHRPHELAAADPTGDGTDFTVLVRPLDDGKPYVREWTYRTASGQDITVQVTLTALRDDDERLGGYIFVCSDVSARRQVETDLRDSEARFRLAFDGAPIGMAMVGLQGQSRGRFLRVNQAMAELTGFSERELVQLSFADLTHPDDLARSEQWVDGLGSGEVDRVDDEKRYHRADGTEVWVHLSSSAIRDDEGRPAYTITQVEDITARKDSQAQLEERFRELATHVGVGFALRNIDPPGFLYVNPAYLTMMGVETDRPGLMPDDVISRMHPDDQDGAKAAAARLFAGEEIVHEMRLFLPSGAQRWIRASYNPIFDDTGAVVRFAGIYEDVTDGKAIELALRESQERFVQLASNVKLGVSLRRLKPPEFLYVNQAYVDIIGADPRGSASPAQAMLAAVHPEDRDRVIADYWLPSSAGEAAESEHRVVHPDGEVRWVFCTSSPVTDDRGQVIRAAGTIEDVTVRKEAEAIARSARLEAERANAAKDEFLSRMSHELRTPLNAVLGFAQLLELDTLSPFQTDAVGHILRGGRHLLAMINDVLDIAGIETDTIELTMEQLPVAELVDESMGLMQPMAASAEITLVRGETEAASTVLVLADRRRLRQVLINLVSNAIKYNRPEGAVTLRQYLTVDGAVAVAVTDTGIGIEAELLPRLFEPFDRLGQSSTIEGTGIGLTLTQRLVEQMNGRIEVTSQPGRGTTFTVVLPVAELVTD